MRSHSGGSLPNKRQKIFALDGSNLSSRFFLTARPTFFLKSNDQNNINIIMSSFIRKSSSYQKFQDDEEDSMTNSSLEAFSFENITFALEILGYDSKDIEEKTNTLIELVELEESIFKFPYQLSGGEQTRVSIARALASNPLLLLCDEPTGNLDPNLSIQIVTLLEKINRAGTTVLMATHDSSIVNRRKKRVLQLKDGKLVSDAAEGRYI